MQQICAKRNATLFAKEGGQSVQGVGYNPPKETASRCFYVIWNIDKIIFR